MARRLHRIDLDGPAGRLEAIHTLPAQPARGAALICHPHPRYGGSMHTKAVYRTARALLDAGYEVLRFNFRGVGRSEGGFDGGGGELDDARAAFDWLQQRTASRRTLLSGFSFGSYIALQLARELAGSAPTAQPCPDGGLHGRVAIGVPLSLYDFSFVPSGGAPLLLIAGSEDPFCPPEALHQLAHRVGAAARVRILPGAGHLLHEALGELQRDVTEFARSLHGRR